MAQRRVNIFKPEVQGARKKNVLERTLASWPLYLALFPTLALIAVFAYWPTVQGVLESLFSSTAQDARVYVGFENYRTLFQDATFWKGFVNALWYFLFGITVGWAIPFVVAELLISISSRRLEYALRTLLILPIAFPAAVFAFVWSFLYDPNDGVFNTFLNSVGLGGLAHNWLGDPHTALGSLMMVGFPLILISSGAGLPFLLILVGLQNIPRDILDAAAIDGCSRVRRVFSIDLPLLGTQFGLLTMLALIGLTQAGSITLLLATGGGPAFSTTTPVVWMVQSGISSGNFGYGAAMGTVLFAVSLLLSLGYQSLPRVLTRLARLSARGFRGRGL